MKTRRGSVVIWVFSGLVLSTCETLDAPQDVGDNGGGMMDMEEYCGPLTYTPVSWDAQTETGVSPRDAFTAAAGSCTAPFSWDCTPVGADMCTPSQGESDIAVTVSFDETSATQGKYATPEKEGMYDCSDTYLKAVAQVHLATADGVFDDAGRVEALYTRETGRGEMRFRVDIDELGGSLRIDDQGVSSTALTYVLDGAGERCAGEIDLSFNENLGGGVMSTGMGVIGSWSNTGCPVGTEPIDLYAPLADGVSAAERFEEIWGNRQFDAVWDTGDITLFNIAARPADTAACRRAYGVEPIPAIITYGTADGGLEERTVSGFAGLTFSEDDLVRAASIDIDDHRVCNDTSNDLGYGFGDCTTLSGVTIQLGMEWHGEGQWNISDDALITYEFNVGNPLDGASDGNHELTFGY